MSNMQITLNEYSNKYRVSISTLRRRIKKHSIEFSFDQGKYYILDKPIHEHTLPPRKVVQKDLAPPHKFDLSGELHDLQIEASNVEAPIFKAPSKKIEDLLSVEDAFGIKASPYEEPAPKLVKTSEQLSEASFSETANELLAELKKAYMMILSEKEERILYLKEEIADLKTLVRVLETDKSAPNLSDFSGFDL